MSIAEAETRFRAGDLAGARVLAERMIATAGPSASAFLVLARIAGEEGHQDEARRMLATGLTIAPDDAQLVAQLAYAYLQGGDMPAALVQAERVRDSTDAPFEALDLAAFVFHAAAHYEAAAEVMARAAELAPSHADLQANLGAVRVLCGDIAGAEAAYRTAIALDPDHARALAALSEVREATGADNNVAAIGRAIGRAADVHDRLVLHHALAREEEALGDPAAAFAALTRGKAAMAEALGYDPARDRAMFATLARLHTSPQSSAPERPDPSTGAGAILIVGMPRSGTTVVERILTALPDVASLGESPYLPGIVRQATGSRSPAILDADALAAAWPRLDLAGIGARYMHHSGIAAGGARHWIDKLPLNLLLAGVAAQAMPKARILWLARGAMDTVIGNYRQMFEFVSGSYDYSLSLTGTASYVADALDLRRSLSQRWPDRILPIDHEAVVADPAGQARRIADFCDLEWDPSCIRIERNARPAGSASAVQVRQPIHAAHVGRWRRYGELLEPARKVLVQRGIDIRQL